MQCWRGVRAPRRDDASRSQAPRREDRDAGRSPPPLPEECWLGALAYLAPRELCACALVPPLRALADDDALWERACDRRWEGKQGVARGELFWRGDYSRARLRPGEMKAILARRADHHGRARASWAALRERAELEAALDASTPAPRPSAPPPRSSGSGGGERPASRSSRRGARERLASSRRGARTRRTVIRRTSRAIHCTGAPSTLPIRWCLPTPEFNML